MSTPKFTSPVRGTAAEPKDSVCSRRIDSAASSRCGGVSASVTTSSRTDGEDEHASTGLSLVVDGVRHLQITTRPVPALKLPTQAFSGSAAHEAAGDGQD